MEGLGWLNELRSLVARRDRTPAANNQVLQVIALLSRKCHHGVRLHHRKQNTSSPSEFKDKIQGLTTLCNIGFIASLCRGISPPQQLEQRIYLLQLIACRSLIRIIQDTEGYFKHSTRVASCSKNPDPFHAQLAAFASTHLTAVSEVFAFVNREAQRSAPKVLESLVALLPLAVCHFGTNTVSSGSVRLYSQGKLSLALLTSAQLLQVPIPQVVSWAAYSSLGWAVMPALERVIGRAEATATLSLLLRHDIAKFRARVSLTVLIRQLSFLSRSVQSFSACYWILSAAAVRAWTGRGPPGKAYLTTNNRTVRSLTIVASSVCQHDPSLLDNAQCNATVRICARRIFSHGLPGAIALRATLSATSLSTVKRFQLISTISTPANFVSVDLGAINSVAGSFLAFSQPIKTGRSPFDHGTQHWIVLLTELITQWWSLAVLPCHILKCSNWAKRYRGLTFSSPVCCLLVLGSFRSSAHFEALRLLIRDDQEAFRLVGLATVHQVSLRGREPHFWSAATNTHRRNLARIVALLARTWRDRKEV